MVARIRNTQGFTLAEVLIAVAIMLVLAALAIPSVITAQNNMRMVELNNAAQAIANAAQTQMTAKKVSGTWLALINGDDGKVKYSKAVGGSNSDTYYMVADDVVDNQVTLKGARSNGIVPSLSIDDTVRKGDFVIEFKASTASVTAVFYTDGKSGFFGAAPDKTAAAQTYYKNGGATDQTARMRNNPMIGYYEGTPAGATNAVALQNPVIWVGDKDEARGKLCIRDANLTEVPPRSTAIEFTVAKKNQEGTVEAAFVVSSIDSSANMISISLEGEESSPTLNDEVYFLDDATNNTYVIDLNKLARIVATGTYSDELKTELKKFQSLDKVEVEAKTSMVGPSVPATAKAIIEWPAPQVQLSVLVTNPQTEGVAQAKHIGGSYVQPRAWTEGKAAILDENKWNTEALTVDHALKFNSTGMQAGYYKNITDQNMEAVHQSYSGGYLDMDTAASNGLKVNAEVGSYTSSANSTHTYQIYEIWTHFKNSDETISQYAKIGYLRNNEWVWENEAFKTFFADPNITETTTQVQVVSQEVKKYLNVNFANANPDDIGCTVYIRTTPRFKDVDAYVRANPEKMDRFSNTNQLGTGTGTGSRGGNLAAEVRKSFESEFGAASSVASWAVSRARLSGVLINNWEFPGNTEDLRIYYDITPAYGFSSLEGAEGWSLVTGDRRYDSTNTGLWYFPKGTDSQFDTSGPVAMLWKPAEEAAGQTEVMVRNTDGNGGASTVDFEIPRTQDYLFYRCLVFFSEDGGKMLDSPSKMYVPYSEASKYVIPRAVDKPEEQKMFAYWTTEPNGGGAKVYPGETVPSYEAAFPALNGEKPIKTRLYAHYVTVGVGLMYLEFDEQNAVSSYYGYTSDQGGLEDQLGETNEIKSWGYYVVVPSKKSQPKQISGPKITGNAVEVDIQGTTFYAYRLNPGDGERKTPSVTVSYSYNDPDTKNSYTGSFQVNFNFAASIAKEGASPQTSSATNASGENVSAWNVRHATQFPGAIKANGGVQEVYMNDCFRQGHSIDMAEVPASVYGNKFIRVFTGVYDGGSKEGFSITNIAHRLFGEVDHCQGLFPKTSGAILRNIAVKFDGEEETNISDEWNSSVNASFGIIAGRAQGGVIENCSVSPVDGNSDAQLKALVWNLQVNPGKNPQGNGNSIGALVGLAEGASIKHCSVKNVSLTIEGSSAWTSSAHRFGGLVGFIDMSGIDNPSDDFIDDLEVASSEVFVNTITDSASGYISIGGVAGLISTPRSSINGWAATSVTLGIQYGQDASRVLAGGFVGATTGSATSFASYTVKNVILSIAGKEKKLDEVLIGNAT